MGDLLGILKFLFVDNAYYLLGIFALVIMVRMFLYWSLISGDYEKHQALFHDAETMVRERTWGNRYLWFLGRLLHRLATWVGDRNVFFRRGREKELPTPVKLHNTLTPDSYDFCLRLAVFYPIFSLLVAWAISGDGKLGTLALFTSDFSLMERLLSLSALIASMLIAFWAVQQNDWKYWVGLLIAVVFVFVFVGAIAVAGAVAVTGAFVIAVATAIVIMGAGAGIFAIAGAGAGAFTGAVIFAVAVALVAGAGIFAIAGDGAIAIAIAITISITYIVAGICEKLHETATKKEALSTYYLALTLFYLVVGFVVFRFVDTANKDLIPLLFLGLLPLANAPIDWLSLGFTRWLLHSILTEKAKHTWSWVFVWVFVDLVVAGFFLLAVSGVVIAVVSTANLLANQPIIDFNALFSSLRSGEHMKNAWVYFMLLSTLIPTFIHFTIAGGALSLMGSRRFRDDLLDGIEKHDAKQRKVFLYVVFMPALGWTLVPVLCLSGLYWLVTTHGSFVGEGLLDAAQWWASYLDTQVSAP